MLKRALIFFTRKSSRPLAKIFLETPMYSDRMNRNPKAVARELAVPENNRVSIVFLLHVVFY